MPKNDVISAAIHFPATRSENFIAHLVDVLIGRKFSHVVPFARCYISLLRRGFIVGKIALLDILKSRDCSGDKKGQR